MLSNPTPIYLFILVPVTLKLACSLGKRRNLFQILPRKRGTRPTTSSCLKSLLATMVQGRWNWGDRGHLIYDFTVSGLLKIKLIGSVCFHRVCSKILVFRPLSSRLTPFFLVWGHVINHSKRNFVSSPLHRKDLSCHRWMGNLFIEEWPQDFHERTFCVTFEIWLFQWLFPITTPTLTGSKAQSFKVPFE